MGIVLYVYTVFLCTPHELLRFNLCSAGIVASIPLARVAAGARRRALHRYRPSGPVGPAARRRLADRHARRPAAAAERHRRDAVVAASAGKRRGAPHRAAAAAASAAGAGAGRARRAALATDLAACRAHGRCAVGSRTGAAQRQLRRAAVLAAARARGKPAPAAPGRAGGGDPVLHDASAGRRAGCLAGAAAPDAQAAGGRHRDRLRQTPGPDFC